MYLLGVDLDIGPQVADPRFVEEDEIVADNDKTIWQQPGVSGSRAMSTSCAPATGVIESTGRFTDVRRVPSSISSRVVGPRGGAFMQRRNWVATSRSSILSSGSALPSNGHPGPRSLGRARRARQTRITAGARRNGIALRSRVQGH